VLWYAIFEFKRGLVFDEAAREGSLDEAAWCRAKASSVSSGAYGQAKEEDDETDQRQAGPDEQALAMQGGATFNTLSAGAGHARAC
jgi:hypothetical protein